MEYVLLNIIILWIKYVKTQNIKQNNENYINNDLYLKTY